MTTINKDEKRPGLFWALLESGTRRPATKNLAPGTTVYNA